MAEGYLQRNWAITNLTLIYRKMEHLPAFVWASLTIAFTVITMIATGRRTATSTAACINWIVTIALIIKAIAEDIVIESVSYHTS